ncbi:hypothetical protein D8674_008814 [Pyrus ussuriensis x Pyrus communis]|uniref:Uncharacterized protein n=1 Tax=Pyrus ussuriensis x Pyrus communis TaxID=2448454 RepID=A0A5N5HTV1_9ROSA|nr:hypothetical protein D8674_008814 [Pyrus ussuriensis x Pyrus communis]
MVWQRPQLGWSQGLARHGLRKCHGMGHGLDCLLRIRKLLEFDFSAALLKMEVLDGQTTKCEVVAEGMMAATEPNVIQVAK